MLVELLVLVVTGVALFFVYRPSAAQPLAGTDAASDAVVSWLRAIHRITSSLTVLSALSTAVLFAVTGRRGRTVTTAAIGAGLVVTVAAASFTGFLLPWDQLALWAVPVGGDINGFRPLLGDQVRFVLIGGTEVVPGTVVRWLGVHALVLTPMAVALVVAVWRRRGGRRPAPEGRVSP